MAWYWWVLIALGILIIIGMINANNELYEEEEETSVAMNRLAAMVIIDDLKYTHPEAWAKCASNIMGRPIDPPTPDQIARWKQQRDEREARKDTGLIR